MYSILRKLVFILFIFHTLPYFSQRQGKDYSNILKSKNIYEINAFLRDAHPDDPRRTVLKPKVMGMMNEYIKNAAPGDQKVRQMQDWLATLKRKPSTKFDFNEMNEALKKKQIIKYQRELQVGQAAISYTPSSSQNVYVTNTSTANYKAIADIEASEFNMLMNENPDEHKNKTVKILNSLFDNDPNTKECIVLIENKSDCNIIVRLEGIANTKYRLPVPAKSENSIVIKKGDYLLTSIVCGAQYASQKTIQKPLKIALGSSSK